MGRSGAIANFGAKKTPNSFTLNSEAQNDNQKLILSVWRVRKPIKSSKLLKKIKILALRILKWDFQPERQVFLWTKNVTKVGFT